jgi:hypothetical protein
MDFRNTLRKAASLIVEMPPEEASAATADTPRIRGSGTDVDQFFANLEQGVADVTVQPANTKTVEQIVRDTDGPNLEDIQVSASAAAPSVAPGGQVDFGAIYQQAGLPAASFSAEQVLEMLAALPTELPLDTRRQTVKVTLNAVSKTVGATPETIVADASRKLAALAAYSENLTRQTSEFTSTAEREIAELEAQILEKRKAIEGARRTMEENVRLCAAESDRLDDVLEFFSLDVAPSKYAS